MSNFYTYFNETDRDYNLWLLTNVLEKNILYRKANVAKKYDYTETKCHTRQENYNRNH